MKIFVTFDYGRVLETGMGIIMSFVLNFSAMYLVGAPLTVSTVLQGWIGALAIAIAINYLFPCMDWAAAVTKGIGNKTAEYVVRVALFSFFEIFINSIWCMANANVLQFWPQYFVPLLIIGTIAIFISLPIMVKVAGIVNDRPC